MKQLVAALAALTVAAGTVTATALPAQAATPTVAPACAAVNTPGLVQCFALRRTDLKSVRTLKAGATPPGLGPSDLKSAYSLPSGGRGATVAVVDAYDNPNAESDLATYRSQYGLPPCTTANRCFKKVNGRGQTSPLPIADSFWAAEISLDLDMVSAVCPKCHILLVEADSPEYADMFGAINTAVSLGAKFVSNSWGSPEFSGETSYDSYLDHPGVAITVSTGDGFGAAQYPATSPYVTAVGGTSLNPSPSTRRGWTESAWMIAESGCSAYEAKPPWQAVTTGCAGRAAADVSAVADPMNGVAVYQTYGESGWWIGGGTSAAAPIIAGVYALAGTPGRLDYPASYPYAHQHGLNDVTSGSNGSCGTPICDAGTGWDGPTGLGTPHGALAFKRPRPIHRPLTAG
ncbi:peptidase S8 [Actinoplanes sp. L3-i22]|nr:peptidase S8 [Actinoplanes sp. L3-i22]